MYIVDTILTALLFISAIWMNSNSMTLKAVPVLEPGGSLLFLTKSSNPSVELIAPTAQVDRPDYLQLGAKLEEGEEAYYYGSPESPAGIAVTEVKTLASPAPLNSSQGSSQHGTLNSPQSLASAPPLSDPKIEDVFYSVNRDFEVGEFLSLDALGFASDIDKYAQQEA
ncbi:hypothetical protein O6H91_07G124900 [Diphasiastrum complanatum]|uniref:Uncharacterized protein n=1 Tax=Diphasiastrum complanatum TaxID=34168 RepID=A0ACC2D9J3_DIPCM|nr:hypothetical protein O6H91_07G124900 [Diphasiastrum complanatum]